jgi:hypothetical protein
MASLNVIMNRNYQSYNSGTVYLLDEGTARGLVNIGVAQLYDVPTSPLAASWRDPAGAVPKDAYWSDATGASLVKPDGSLTSFGSASYTWATRPSAVAAGSGAIITITDIAAQPHQRISDGTYWRPLAPFPLLSQMTEITKTDTDTNTQTVFSISIPGGFLPPGTYIAGEITFFESPGNTNNKTFNVTFGGNNAGSLTIGNTQTDIQGLVRILARTTGEYRAWDNNSTYGQAAAALTITQALDLTTAQTLAATIKFNTGGAGSNTLTFRPCKLICYP